MHACRSTLEDPTPFKPRADVLVAGAVHAPGGKVTVAQATIQVGMLLKTLIAVGDRVWEGGLLRGKSQSDPKPFAKIPLSYRLAHGGPEFALNPSGRGHKTDALPNLELPGRLITSPKEKTPPAGFGPLAPEWEPRRTLVGTYHDKWAAERWPCPPRDFDWGHFNAAPADQQVEGYLRGDEPLRFQNLHPTEPDFVCSLPGLRARCFLDRLVDGAPKLDEVELVLDTLWCEVDTETAVLVWRGRTKVRSAQMTDLLSVFVCAEALDAPKPTEAEVRKRMARVDAEEVEPEEPAEQGPTIDEEMAALEADFAAERAEIAKLDAEGDAAEKAHVDAIARAGFVLPAVVPDPIAELTKRLAQPGIAPDQAARLRETLAAVNQANADCAALEASFAKLEADDAAEEVAPLTRDDVVARLMARTSLAGAELAKLDLSGLDFSNADLRGADLGGANLAGALLRGADLTRASASGAVLTGADLEGAKLERTDLTGSTVAGARFCRASLADADLSGLDLSGLDFGGATGERADFSGAKLAGASFASADLPRADFIESDLTGADFTGAGLTNADLHSARAAGACFRGARLDAARASRGADFSDAVFDGVSASESVWDGCVLARADLAGARFPGAQFAGAKLDGVNADRADLRGAVFDDASLLQARLVAANLLRASFTHADLRGANLVGANLFEAGFVDANTEGAKLDGANVDRTLLARRR